MTTLWRSTGPLPGDRRCFAVGLGSDSLPCQQERWPGSSYCYYHDKVQRGQCEPHVEEAYPIWPLPAEGYVIPAMCDVMEVA